MFIDIKEILVQQRYEQEILKIVACRPDLTYNKVKEEINELVETTTESYDYWIMICKHDAMSNKFMPWEKEFNYATN